MQNYAIISSGAVALRMQGGEANGDLFRFIRICNNAGYGHYISGLHHWDKEITAPDWSSRRLFLTYDLTKRGTASFVYILPI
jgi:hypothetical protein